MTTTICIIAAIVILIIAFKKEIVSLFEKISASSKERKAEKRKLSPETKRLLKEPGVKKFLLIAAAVIIGALILIGIFALSVFILPGESGYFVGGGLILIIVFGVPLALSEM